METRRITVLSAGLGVPSSTRLLADQLAAAATRELTAAGYEVTTDVVELRELAVDIANNFVTGFAPPRLAEVIAAVEAADGIIAVSPVFSASYSGLFKSFVDVLEPGSLAGKPVLIGATGGTARHSLVLDYALRPLFTYLKTIVVPTGVFAASEDWAGTTLAARIDRAAGELAHELTVRERTVAADPFANPTPFERLLG